MLSVVPAQDARSVCRAPDRASSLIVAGPGTGAGGEDPVTPAATCGRLCKFRELLARPRRLCLYGSAPSRPPIAGLSIDPPPCPLTQHPAQMLQRLTARRENDEGRRVARSAARIRTEGVDWCTVPPSDLYQLTNAPSTHFRPRARRSPSHPRCGRDREETNATVAQSDVAPADQLAYPRPTSCLRLCVDLVRRTAKI